MGVATFNVYPNEVEVLEGLALVAVVKAPCIREQGLHLAERHAFHARNEEGAARALLGNIAMDRAVADGHFFIPFFFFFFFFFSFLFLAYFFPLFLTFFLLFHTKKEFLDFLVFLSKYFWYRCCTGEIILKEFRNESSEAVTRPQKQPQ